MRINEFAPVTASAAVRISAGPDVIWDLLADIDGWPAWHTDVRSASLTGPLAVGAEFRWRAGPAKLVSTIRTVERPTQLSWTGRTMGMKAVHVWRLAHHAGHTRVHTEESWDGLLARLLRRTMRRSLQKSLDTWLRDLKTAAEARESSPR